MGLGFCLCEACDGQTKQWHFTKTSAPQMNLFLSHPCTSFVEMCVCVCCCLFVIFFFRFLYSTFAASLCSVEVGAAAAGFLRRHGHHCLGGCLLRPASDGRVIGREREGLHNGGRMFETWEFRKLSKNTSCVIQVIFKTLLGSFGCLI